MKLIILTFILLFCLSTSGIAEEPRTVGVYKRHMNSDDHNVNDFDHTLHHLLYLSGVADAYTSINTQRKKSDQHLLYCKPETTKLSGADIMEILDIKLYHPENPAADNQTVSEALLQALKEKFPCP